MIPGKKAQRATGSVGITTTLRIQEMEAKSKMNSKILRLMAAAGITAMLLGTTVPAEETYFSELTGEPISIELKDQRPVAVIVDNETIAYPHFGLGEADIVYELINSTKNGHITRLMALIKDWKTTGQTGNLRSVRPTNILLAADYNAVLVHDGGPFYVDQYFAKDYARDHLSGGFTRIDNGKPTEFTEYFVEGELEQRFAAAGISTNYTGHAQEKESHFRFAPEGSPAFLFGDPTPANTVRLPFEHTNSTLKYNPATRTYDYYCYDKLHVDEEDGDVLTFKNVIIQECTYTLLDENGYMIYNCIDENQPGWYITNGEAVPITWTKAGETNVTRYYAQDGTEIMVNRGKTYITLVPDDKWDSLVIE